MFNINRYKFTQIGSVLSSNFPFPWMRIELQRFVETKVWNAEASVEHLFNIIKQQGRKCWSFFHWCWNGDCVEIEEIKRELGIKDVEVGGVGLKPTRFLGNTDTFRNEEFYYLCDEWTLVLQAIVKETKKREVTCDTQS